VNDKKFLITKKTIADGISLRVETRIVLLDEKYLVDKTINFPCHFFRMRNWLSLMRLVSPWAVEKCLPIAEKKKSAKENLSPRPGRYH